MGLSMAQARGLLSIVMIVLLAAGAARANDAAALRAAMARADAGDHAAAAQEARGAADPLVAELAAWRRIADGEGSYAEARLMLERRPEWPRSHQLRRAAERGMRAGLPADEALSFFRDRAPLTASGAMALAAAQAQSGDRAAAQATLVSAWTELDMTQAEREAFEARHRDVSHRHAAARLDAMLWEGAEAQARALYPLVDGGWRALAEARIALRNRENGVDARIAAVPSSLQNHPGLAYERFVWRARADRYEEAEALLNQRTGSAEALGRPDAWAGRRAMLARRAFRDGRVAEAYRLASQHHLITGTDFADLEWLSGWIALRGMRDPNRAAGHFLRHFNDVATPISKGRGAYWLGRAYEAAGDATRAATWYAEGAAHPTSFYGQLAAEKAGVGVTGALRARSDADWRRASWAGSDTVRAIRLLQQAGRDNDVRAFLLGMASRVSTAEDYAALGDLALDIGRPDGAVVVAKNAARDALIVMDHYYPIVDVVRARGPVEPAFALAIARQESEMNPAAVSPAGARGLMQLMPGTAQQVSRQLGIAYRLEGLTTDPAYNVQLGQAYLGEMLARFGGAKILAAAAYNAGPHRVDEWLGRLGDPRRADVDAIDWIEHIPFTETRNYVQRVLEGLHVYRARLGEDMAGSFSASLVRPQG